MQLWLICVQLAVPLLPAMQGVKAYNKGAKSEEYSKPVVDEVTRSEPIFTPTQEESAVLGTIESYTLKTVLFKADPFPTPGPIYPGEVRPESTRGDTVANSAKATTPFRSRTPVFCSLFRFFECC